MSETRNALERTRPTHGTFLESQPRSVLRRDNWANNVVRIDGNGPCWSPHEQQLKYRLLDAEYQLIDMDGFSEYYFRASHKSKLPNVNDLESATMVTFNPEQFE